MLEELSVFDMPFTDLPLLPSGLLGLQVSWMPGMQWLPQMPLGLTYLWVTFMPDLLSLPLLPGTVQSLMLQEDPGLQALPDLPISLVSLYLIDCDGIGCLPTLPAGLQVLTVYSSTIDCLPAPLGPFVFADLSFDPSTICIAPCDPMTPLLGGRVFHDLNANGSWDPFEPPLPGAVVTVAPGGLYGSTDSTGGYLFTLPPGNFDLTAGCMVPYPQSSSPAMHSHTLVLPTEVDTSDRFGIWLEPGHHDLAAAISATAARPGFDNVLHLVITNLGTEPVDGTVTLDRDADQLWVAASVAPNSIAGQQAVWNVPVLDVGASWHATITLTTPVGTALGTPIDHDLNVSANLPDEVPGNDQSSVSDVVVGSYDPNDKHVVPEELTLSDLLTGEPVVYTIRFQNTGTAPASFVEILDTLNTFLQWPTVRFVAASHPCTWELRNGILRFRFDPIILPDSVSDEPASHGFVRFGIVPAATLVPGTVVPNRAHIYFDYNEPVVTDPAVFTITLPTAVPDQRTDGMVAFPVPAHDLLWVAIPGAPGSIVELDLMDLSGRKLRTMVMPRDHCAVDIRDLSAGTYLLRARSSMEAWTAHFIKE